MKSIRSLVALFLVSVFLAGHAFATTSSVNPNVPLQNSPLSSAVLRGQFANTANDLNVGFAIDTLSSNQILGTVNAGNAGPLNVPSCSSGALSWTPGSGFGCNSINGLTSPVTQALVFTGAIGFNQNTTGLQTKQTGTVLQVSGVDTIAARTEIDAFGASAYFTGIRWDGTNGAPTTLQSGDEIAGFNAWGYNGSTVAGPKASLREFAAQNWTTGANGTYVDIATTPIGTTALAQVIKFENDGGITIPATVTGGDQGAGKLNAGGLYVNGVSVLTTLPSQAANTVLGALSVGSPTALTMPSCSAGTSALTWTTGVGFGCNTISGGGGGGTVTLGTSTTVANPQISGDATSGVYSDAAQKIRMAIAGSKVIDIGTTGLGVTGTASANSFIPTSSTIPTDGVYLPASNTLGIADNSHDVIRAIGVSSGVDYFQFTNAATAGTASLGLAAAGTDTNINLTLTPAGTGVVGVTGPETITSANAKALAVGLNGSTNPALAVDASTALSATGINVKSGISGGTTVIQATDSGGSSSLSLFAKSGNLAIGNSAGTPEITLNAIGTISITPTQSGFGTATQLLFTPPTSTALTASVEDPIAYFNMSADTQQHSTGALALQRDFLIKGAVDSFVGASTLTDGATLGLVLKNCGTNGTCTNESGLWVKSSALTGSPTNSYAAKLEAATGATNNYAANFVGDIVFTGAAPTISACGSGAAASGATDHKGQITGVTTATTCTITFSQALATGPSCHVMGGTSGALAGAYISAISTAAVTFTFTSYSGSLYYMCF